MTADDLPGDFCPDGTDDWADPIQAFIDRNGEMPDLPAGTYWISRPLMFVGGGGGSGSGGVIGGGGGRGSAT